MSTNFLVTQAQRDLATAAVNELPRSPNYRKSVINFQRVQEAGVSGSGTVAVLAAAARSAQASQADPVERRGGLGHVQLQLVLGSTPMGHMKGGPPAPLPLSPRLQTLYSS